mgnify:FL=1
MKPFEKGDKVRLKQDWLQINEKYVLNYGVKKLREQEGLGDMIITKVFQGYVNVTPDIGYRYRFELLEHAKEENEI